MMDQRRAPICEALEEYRKNRIVSFDVPGHKQGKGHKGLTEFFGEKTVSIDVNSMKSLDNLNHPTSVIKEGEELSAEAFGARHAFLMTGGTSSAVAAMIMSCCRQGDKILMPRNVHRSAINTLVVCGAIPVYINPGVEKSIGISLGMSLEGVKKAMAQHPDAKAILVNNPTYYGVCSPLQEIVAEAEKYGIKVLVDEAHGTHFYFGQQLPRTAMEAGAHMAAVSMHKTGGSLTQSSFLLCGSGVNPHYVRQIINLTSSTSNSYLLMASLDLARRNLALHGKEIFQRVADLTAYAREEINKLGGFYAFGEELINGQDIYDFDKTKLSIHTRTMGLAGIEVYDILRDEYGIQIEFGDIGNVLAIVSVGDRELEIERLISALAEIRRRYQKDPAGMLDHEYINPVVDLSPQTAFYSPKESAALLESQGRICAEFVMCYPPGIPVLAPGERITRETLEYILYAEKKGCLITGPQDMELKSLMVVK